MGDEAEWSARTPKIAEHQALEGKMDEAGKFIDGKALKPRSEAVTVRRREGAQRASRGQQDFLVTDGPFAEAKEHIAGFYIINADDLDEALGWARRVVEVINVPIEVRPFFGMPAS